MQKKVTKKQAVTGGVAAAALALALPFLLQDEGLETRAYLDIANIPTICVGHTGPEVALGQVSTETACRILLHKDSEKILRGILPCITRQDITIPELAALVRFSFNVGVSAFCSSTLTLLLNRGEPAEKWCSQLLRWNKITIYSPEGVRKVPVKGLTARRQREYQMCIGK